MTSPTGEVRSGPLSVRCPLNPAHDVAMGELAEHLIEVHGASDTAQPTHVEINPTRHVGEEDTHWHEREQMTCVICERHGVAVGPFLALRESEEARYDYVSTSVERHLKEDHGAT